MAAVAHLGDAVFSETGTGYQCSSPDTTVKIYTPPPPSKRKVFADGKAVARNNDKVTDHKLSGCGPDTDILIKSYSRVFAEGEPCARIGDKAASDNTIIEGSGRVFFG